MITADAKIYISCYPYEIEEDEQYFIALTISHDDIIQIYINDDKLETMEDVEEVHFPLLMKNLRNPQLFCIGTSVKNFKKIYKSGLLTDLSNLRNSLKGRISKLFVINKTLNEEEILTLYLNNSEIMYEDFYQRETTYTLDLKNLIWYIKSNPNIIWFCL